MSLVPLLILPLVGGYAFSCIWYPSIYHASRESGHRLYFRAAFYGFFISIVSFEVHILLSQSSTYRDLIEFGCSNTLVLDCTDNFLLLSIPSLIAVSFLSIFLGPLLAHLLNLFTRTRWKLWLAWKAVNDNDFESLIFGAFINSHLLIITLNSNKVYVGWPVSASNPSSVRKHLRILPYLSGFRDSESHKVEFTTDYYDILTRVYCNEDEKLKHLKVDDFEVIIPVDQIAYSHIFDLGAYINFYDEDSEESVSR